MRGGKPYDVIVLGAGLSGLLAAALLARRGRHVLVLEEDIKPGSLSHQIPRGKYTFLDGPFLFLGFEREGIYDRIFMELGLSLTSLKREGKLFRKSSPPFQLILPGHRLNIFEDEGNLIDELSREFPSKRSQIGAFIETVGAGYGLLRPMIISRRRRLRTIKDYIYHIQGSIKEGMKTRLLQRRMAKKIIEEFNLDQELQRGIELILSLFTGKPFETATELDLLFLFGLMRREIIGMNGGIPQLAELLIGVIRKFHGDVIFSHIATELVIQRKNVIEIRTPKDIIKVPGHCIVNIPVSRLPGMGSKREILAFHYGIPSAKIPSPMMNTLLVGWSLHVPGTTENGFFITLSGQDEKWAAPEGQRSLRVIVGVDGRTLLDEGQVNAIRQMVEKQIRELIPFSNQSLLFLGTRTFPVSTSPRLAALDDGLINRARIKGWYGMGYCTLPTRNLFLLPDYGHQAVAHVGEAKSAMALADRIVGL